jgi:ankyrin repeat protein
MSEIIDAIKTGDASRVAQLLDGDPSLLREKEGNTSAILLAVYYRHPEVAKLFVDRGAALTFGEAIALGDAGRVDELLQRDPSLISSFTDDGFPPAGLAIFFRHPEIARSLIERGADVNAASRNAQKVAPVHAAASVGDCESMRLLLERGADPNTRQQDGFLAIHATAMHGDRALIELLVAHGADVHATAADGKTAADFAAAGGHAELAAWLREQ